VFLKSRASDRSGLLTPGHQRLNVLSDIRKGVGPGRRGASAPRRVLQ
jgi:hypothetical protein